MNAQQQWQELNDRVESLMAEGGVRNVADAFDEVRRRYPHLRDAKRPEMAGVAMTMPSSASRAAVTASHASSAEEELERRAKKIAADRRCSFAQAYVDALRSDPHLYLAYLREKQAKIAAEARRG